MTIGIIYIVFGLECDKLAAHCVAYSRQFTSLPIRVITNIPEGARSLSWPQNNIIFEYFHAPIEANRHFKTTMIKHAPFDFNIYMDADSIVQSKDFDELIEKMTFMRPDLILNLFCEYPYSDGRFQNIYLRASRQFGCSYPLKVYNGALIGFRKNDAAENFFFIWNRLWLEFGAEREMPPLAAAINKLDNINIANLPPGFFAPDCRDDNSIVQHNYNQDFFGRVGLSDPIYLRLQKYSADDYSFTNINEANTVI